MKIKEKELKHKMIDRNLNQAAICKMLGHNNSWLTNIKSKGASENIIKQIAVILNTSVSEIAYYEEIKK
jgi:hypothetical protein